MVDKHSYKDYFNKVIKFDPVNNYFIFTKDELIELKNKLTKESKNQLKQELAEVFHAQKASVCDKLMNYGFHKNDYVSLATYWWKDETKPEGIPYINRDGYANPEGALYDKDKFRLLAYITYYGALMYFITEDQSYNELIKNHLTHWFLDNKFGMNPNMDHAQYIPGVNDGRGKGIIDYAANFAYSLHMLTHLRSFGLLDKDLDDGLIKWHQNFYLWCTTSKNGNDEKNELNNHGTQFDFMMVVINQFLDNEVDYNLLLSELNNRIEYQVNNEGFMPLELKRTKSKSYSLMGAKGLYDTAKLLETKLEVRSEKLDKLLINLVEYLVEEKRKWVYEQVTIFDNAVLIPLYLEVKRRLNKDYKTKLENKEMIFNIPVLLFL